MSAHSKAVITTAQERPLEEWNDPSRGRISWHTLFSSDRTPTDSMTAGVAEIVPGSGGLQLHRHEQSEIYFILEGTGILTVDGRETEVTTGTAAFIPGKTEHGIRNESNANVKLFYVFPTGSFEDVVSRFGRYDLGLSARNRELSRPSITPFGARLSPISYLHTVSRMDVGDGMGDPHIEYFHSQ